MKLLVDQKEKWTGLIEEHRREEKELRDKHFKVFLKFLLLIKFTADSKYKFSDSI